MGSFYVNLTVRTTNQMDVIAALENRSAIITSPQGGCIVVADEEADKQNIDDIRSLAQRLSLHVDAPVFAVLNHDDDILWYCLSRNGEIVDEYDSTPGYFESGMDLSLPVGGNAKELCAAFGSSALNYVEEVLRKSSYNNDGYAFAYDRHAELAKVLGLPNFSVGFCFGGASAGYLPEGLSEENLVRVR